MYFIGLFFLNRLYISSWKKFSDYVNFDIQCSTSEYNVFKYAKGVNYFIKKIRQIIFLIFFGEILECWRLLSELFSSFKKVH